MAPLGKPGRKYEEPEPLVIPTTWPESVPEPVFVPAEPEKVPA